MSLLSPPTYYVGGDNNEGLSESARRSARLVADTLESDSLWQRAPRNWLLTT